MARPDGDSNRPLVFALLSSAACFLAERVGVESTQDGDYCPAKLQVLSALCIRSTSLLIAA